MSGKCTTADSILGYCLAEPCGHGWKFRDTEKIGAPLLHLR